MNTIIFSTEQTCRERAAMDWTQSILLKSIQFHQLAMCVLSNVYRCKLTPARSHRRTHIHSWVSPMSQSECKHHSLYINTFTFPSLWPTYNRLVFGSKKSELGNSMPSSSVSAYCRNAPSGVSRWTRCPLLSLTSTCPLRSRMTESGSSNWCSPLPCEP